MIMQKFAQKLKYLPTIIAIVVFVVGIASFFFLKKEINKKNEEANIIAVTVETETSNKNRIRQLGSFLDMSSVEIAELDTHFIYRKDVVPFLQFVEDLGSKAGLSAEVSSVDESADGQTLFVSADIEGSFVAVYKFLKLIENAPYKVEITTLDLQSSVQDSGSVWSGSVQVKVISFIP